jgi:3-hydroxyisobutyrate dehydrogenase-like beta-hydroxyacid dehydrogenase
VELAEQVAGTGYRGVYVDANAIPPALASRIRDLIVGAGGSYVDGSIIGPPANEPGSTRVYLSGTGAASVAELFVVGPADAVVLDGHFTAASALKMVYAAYTKGSAALLLAVVGAATSLGVGAPLRDEWAMSDSDLPERSDRLLEFSGRKAWRFEGEMRFISETFESAGLPGGFHTAAAEVYRRIAGQAGESFPVSHDRTLIDLLDGAEPASLDAPR